MNLNEIANKIIEKIKTIFTRKSTPLLPRGIQSNKGNFRNNLQPPTFDDLQEKDKKIEELLSSYYPNGRKSSQKKVIKYLTSVIENYFNPFLKKEDDITIYPGNKATLYFLPRILADNITYAFSTYYTSEVTDPSLINVEEICDSLRKIEIPYSQKDQNGTTNTQNLPLEEVLEKVLSDSISRLDIPSVPSRYRSDFLKKESKNIIDTVLNYIVKGEITNLRECSLLGEQLAIRKAMSKHPECDDELRKNNSDLLYYLFENVINETTVNDNVKKYFIAVARAKLIGDSPSLIPESLPSDIQRFLSQNTFDLKGDTHLSPNAVNHILCGLYKAGISVGIMAPSNEPQNDRTFNLPSTDGIEH